MNCRQAERHLLRSMDHAPDEAGRRALDLHLRDCPRCRELAADYAVLRDGLHGLPQGSPKPYFWERLKARLDAPERPEPSAVWQKWCLRAIPVSLFVIGLFIGGMIFLPAGDDGLSQSETLLLRDSNPLAETNALLDESRTDDKNILIIFAASERPPERRPQP
jgi:predicted anti-sigma-YlaC factor YlaD